MNAKTPLYMKLKALRTEHNMTQKEVSEYLNVSRQAISLWETGKTYPDVDNLVSLCKLYHISLDTLLENENTVPKKSTDFDYVIKQLIAAIFSTILSQYAIIGMLFPILIFPFFRKEKHCITMFHLYIFFTFILGGIQTYYFLY